MTDVVADDGVLEPGAADFAAGETGFLRRFNEAGVLTSADIHVARRLSALSDGVAPDEVMLAAALAVRAVRTGSICVALADLGLLDPDPEDPLPWPSVEAMVAALRSSPLVVGGRFGPLRPLALVDSDDGPLVYLRKYFEQEQTIRRVVDARAASTPAVDVRAARAAIDEVFLPGDGDVREGPAYDRQRAAAALAATSWTTVLVGGPGTGKTHTVARILAVLERLMGGNLRIGLCAPTGRAAAQLQASINRYDGLASTPVAHTVHALLGIWRDGTVRHGPNNRLPYDVVVVDETSMLSVTTMSLLLQAVREDTRLILVGDPHQLVSVEAGAVLTDLTDRALRSTAPLPPAFAELAGLAEADFSDEEKTQLGGGVLTLRWGYRYGSAIARVADAVNRGDADAALALIEADGGHHIDLVGPDEVDDVRADTVAWLSALDAAGSSGDARAAVTALESYRVLCAHRDGRYGVGWWSRIIDSWRDAGRRVPRGPWPVGQPLLVTATDRRLGIFNGDTGVVVSDERGGDVTVAFDKHGDIVTLHPSQLADAIPATAMTIHRSQGSQFDVVTVVLPPSESALLTRELLYTAITRARKRVRIVGTPEWLRAAVDRRVARASGLRGEVREHVRE
ncbi:exodeoxyribonuclease V alpha chain [Gordonia araii NBRC 100433]|uniref:RecBCD enzyme subunit RecD n=1 Tax=Gordonia araii NBRC 100433 TaxID=1073574 RepID=G7H031_9ACTN|nr:exodeoxyribonuclease V subunit alpha [Gordonia araii]NNG99060.1 exodeoxyribonuclease V subunit alpha [Gordonia araii NBRC 100433]GAB09206.1 exodeoxyribonuclease V alpha chain [Gordonia araii NBRC 100433]